MRANPNKSGRPTTLVDQLADEKKLVRWIAELTAGSTGSVWQRLQEEQNSPGINVARAFQDSGLDRYLWSEQLASFYGQTDGFLYELAIWNRNRLKRRMRRRVEKYLQLTGKKNAEVLFIGDGLGVDSVYLAQSGYRVTYFEIPGYSERFARMLFDEYPQSITVITDPDEIPTQAYDAVVCLDVLEHLPDPRKYVGQMAGYLRDGGILIAHSPFYMIHPTTPTHLKANRRFSGSISLYKQHDLQLIDGDLRWNPIVLRKSSNTKPSLRLKPRLWAIRLAGIYLMLGRFSVLPFWWLYRYRNKWNLPFDEI